MGKAVDESSIDKFKTTHEVFEKYHNLISSMLKVRRDTDGDTDGNISEFRN